MLPLFRVLFKSMWQIMHATGYFAKHPHYRDWTSEKPAPAPATEPPADSFLRGLDFSADDIFFPGNYSNELEREIKKYENYWLPRMFDLPGSGTAVDLGCGFGRSIEWLQHRYSRVVGVDISKQLLRQARDRFRESPNVEFLLGNGVTLPPEIAHESVDLIYSFTVFQHIPRSFLRSYLGAFKQKTRRGGSVVFNILSGIHEGTRVGKPFSEWSIGYHPGAVRELAGKAGFRIAREVNWRLAQAPGFWTWFHLIA